VFFRQSVACHKLETESWRNRSLERSVRQDPNGVTHETATSGGTQYLVRSVTRGYWIGPINEDFGKSKFEYLNFVLADDLERAWALYSNAI